MNLFTRIKNKFFSDTHKYRSNYSEVDEEAIIEFGENQNSYSKKDFIPSDLSEFKDCHYKVMRRLDGHPVNQDVSGLISLEVDIPRFIPVLIRMGLLTYAKCGEALSYLTVNELKQILGENHLPVSGRKSELIHRILNNVDESHIKESSLYNDLYVLTSKGHSAVSCSYSRYDPCHEEYFKELIKLILSQNFASAYRIICKVNSDSSVSPGLNCDWDYRYKNGISEKMESLYSSYYHDSGNKLLASAAIYAVMTGIPSRSVNHDILSYFSESPESFEMSDPEKLRTAISVINGRINLSSYIDSGIEKYRFFANLDDFTCPICCELDGRVFFVKESCVGVNFPPIHDACRCTTVAEFDRSMIEHSTRNAKDSATGDVIKVPFSMNWTEWKEKYRK